MTANDLERHAKRRTRKLKYRDRHNKSSTTKRIDPLNSDPGSINKSVDCTESSSGTSNGSTVLAVPEHSPLVARSEIQTSTVAKSKPPSSCGENSNPYVALDDTWNGTGIEQSDEYTSVGDTEEHLFMSGGLALPTFPIVKEFTTDAKAATTTKSMRILSEPDFVYSPSNSDKSSLSTQTVYTPADTCLQGSQPDHQGFQTGHRSSVKRKRVGPEIIDLESSDSAPGAESSNRESASSSDGPSPSRNTYRTKAIDSRVPSTPSLRESKRRKSSTLRRASEHGRSEEARSESRNQVRHHGSDSSASRPTQGIGKLMNISTPLGADMTTDGVAPPLQGVDDSLSSPRTRNNQQTHGAARPDRGALQDMSNIIQLTRHQTMPPMGTTRSTHLLQSNESFLHEIIERGVQKAFKTYIHQNLPRNLPPSTSSTMQATSPSVTLPNSAAAHADFHLHYVPRENILGDDRLIEIIRNRRISAIRRHTIASYAFATDGRIRATYKHLQDRVNEEDWRRVAPRTKSQAVPPRNN